MQWWSMRNWLITGSGRGKLMEWQITIWWEWFEMIMTRDCREADQFTNKSSMHRISRCKKLTRSWERYHTLSVDVLLENFDRLPLQLSQWKAVRILYLEYEREHWRIVKHVRVALNGLICTVEAFCSIFFCYWIDVGWKWQDKGTICEVSHW